MTLEEKQALLDKLSSELNQDKQARKDTYLSLRTDFVARIKDKLYKYLDYGREFKKWLEGEAAAFYEVMREYGHLKRDDQIGFKVEDEDFRFHVKGNKVKGFDERADVAAKRLVDYMEEWVKTAEKGVKNPLYKVTLALLKRNEMGDFDNKLLSILYEAEGDFADPEYTEIMELFRESNVVERTAIHFYFEEKGPDNRWSKIEPSFNRM